MVVPKTRVELRAFGNYNSRCRLCHGTYMAVTPAKRTEIARRRQLVGELYVQGWTQARIAQEFGVTQATISTDVKSLHEQWRASGVRDFDLARSIELEKLNLMEREAWEAWKRSSEPSESTKVTSTGENNKRAEKTVKQRVGDPRFLEQLHKCMATRRALLGLDAPTKIAPTSPDGEEAYHSHVISKLMQLAEQSHQSPDVIDGQFIEQALNANYSAVADDSDVPTPSDNGITDDAEPE